MSTDWTKKSFEEAEKEGYVDRVRSKAYDIKKSQERRDLSNDLKKKAREAYKKGDDKELVRAFLEFDKFPFDNVFVGLLRSIDDLENNPDTIDEISSRIREMGIEEAFKQCSAPKVTNRKLVNKFEQYVETDFNFPKTSSLDKFKENPRSKNYLVFTGSGKQIKDFINDKGVDINKEPDLLCKKEKHETTYIVGEAKFLTSRGGHQSRQLDDVINLLEYGKKNVKTIGIVDGVPWFNKNNQMGKKMINAEGDIISVLLLEEYIKSI